MSLRRLLCAAPLFILLRASAAYAAAPSQSPSPMPVATILPSSHMESPPPLPNYSLAPFEQRLANAKSVRVMTSILGIELGSTLEHAHEKLDKLCDSAHRPKEEKDEREGEHKVLWQLAKTDYAFVFVKAEDEDKITYVNGFLRPGKEVAFDKVGELKKAPVQDANTTAWDVLRANHPLFRVIASGSNRKASNIMIFVVKRPGFEKESQH